MTRAGTGVTRWTRVRIGAQVLFVVLLASLLCGLVVWLARRPLLHVRFDATRGNRESLSPELVELFERLPAPVTAEAFFTPVQAPYDRVVEAVHGQTEGLLFIAANQYPARLRFVKHDTGDVARTRDALRSLGVDEDNVVVLHAGGLRAILRLGDLADIDLRVPGPGQNARPELTRYKGQEALYRALRQVSSARAPQVYFSWGHGEPDIRSGASTDLSALAQRLTSDGFAVERWEPGAGAAVPKDCDVLAIVAPEMPLAPETADAVRAYLARGGRLLAVPDERYATGPGSVAELCAEVGLRIEPGTVCRPFTDRFGRTVSAGPACTDMRIGVAEGQLNANHPVTRPLWRQGQSVRFVRSHAVRPARDSGPAGVALQPLATSPESSWIERPPPSPGAPREHASNVSEWNLDTESQAAEWLAAAAEFFARAADGGAGPTGPLATPDAELPRGRVLVIGSALALASDPEVFATNRAFLLNAFNWLASREHLVTISRAQIEQPTLDVAEGSALRIVFWISLVLLPGLCFALGGLIWWRRSR